MLQCVTSISLSKEKFQFIPLIDSTRAWTDEDLYKEYDLSDEEITFIESMIKDKKTEGEN